MNNSIQFFVVIIYFYWLYFIIITNCWRYLLINLGLLCSAGCFVKREPYICPFNQLENRTHNDTIFMFSLFSVLGKSQLMPNAFKGNVIATISLWVTDKSFDLIYKNLNCALTFPEFLCLKNNLKAQYDLIDLRFSF